MNTLDPVSVGIGVIVSILTVIVGYFFTRIWFFKTRIFYPFSYQQQNDNFRISVENGDWTTAAYLQTVIKITGWQPARGVEIFISGEFDFVEFSPKTPFQIDKDRNSIKVGSMNTGLYNIKIQRRELPTHSFLTIDSIESTNSECFDKRLEDPRFESFRDHILSWPVFLPILGYLLIDLAFKVASK